jgi:protein SCO1
MNSVGLNHRSRARLQRAAAALAGRPLFWIVLVGGIASWPFVWSLSAPVPGPLPVIATLPRFELLDQGGGAFGSKDLDGRVWVAGFIFTRCPTLCPLITATMVKLQGRTRQLVPDFHMVSFSADPDHDTPARLGEYARAHRASLRGWTFLSGAPAALRTTVEHGIEVGPGKDERRGSASGGIFHTRYLALIDRMGRIRGYYDSTDADDVDRLVRDVGWLVNRGS